MAWGRWFILGICVFLHSVEAHIYTVNVPVDKNASSAQEAKTLAMEEATLEAWKRLIKKMVVEKDQAKVPTPSSEKLSSLVANFSVQNERSSPLRYLATIAFSFDPLQIRSILKKHNVAFSEKEPPTVLVVPFQRGGESCVLWNDLNPWLLTWQKLEAPGGLFSFRTPLGDAEDQRLLTQIQILKKDAGALKALATRYGVSHVLMMGLLAPSEPQLPHRIDIEGLFFSPNEIKKQEITIDNIEEAEKAQEALATIALQRLEEQWKQNHLHGKAPPPSQETVMTLPVKGLQNLEHTLDHIRKMPQVEDLKIKTLSTQSVTVTLLFSGDLKTLQQKIRGLQ